MRETMLALAPLLFTVGVVTLCIVALVLVNRG